MLQHLTLFSAFNSRTQKNNDKTRNGRTEWLITDYSRAITADLSYPKHLPEVVESCKAEAGTALVLDCFLGYTQLRGLGNGSALQRADLPTVWMRNRI